VSVKSIVVSGGNGLLGRATIKMLSADFKVTALVRQLPLNPYHGVEYIELDLAAEWDTSVLPENCDVVIHLAQSNNYKDFPGSALEVYNVNLSSTLKLLDYGRRANISRFILASTGGLYPQNRLPLNEQSELFALDKLTHYLGTKLSAEIFARNYLPYFDVDMLRIFFMYGPGQKINMLVPRLITSILDGKPVLLPGGNGIALNPIYVSDVATVIKSRIASQGSAVLNVSGQEVVTIKELANRIGAYLGKDPVFEIDKPQLDLVSESKLCLEMLSGQTVSLDNGLACTIDWIHELRRNG